MDKLKKYLKAEYIAFNTGCNEQVFTSKLW